MVQRNGYFAYQKYALIAMLGAGHAMEWKIVWNGRRILEWNMEHAQNGMEDLENGMEGRLPF